MVRDKVRVMVMKSFSVRVRVMFKVRLLSRLGIGCR